MGVGPPEIAGERGAWRFWAVVPFAGAAVSIALGAHKMGEARRYLSDLDPGSIDGFNRNVASFETSCGIVGFFCGACLGMVAIFLLGRPAFDRGTRSMVWGSAAYLAGFLPWLGDPFSPQRYPGLVGVWAVGALALLIGIFWSSGPEFTHPYPVQWWHAPWLPWTPAFVAFVSAAILTLGS